MGFQEHRRNRHGHDRHLQPEPSVPFQKQGRGEVQGRGGRGVHQPQSAGHKLRTSQLQVRTICVDLRPSAIY